MNLKLSYAQERNLITLVDLYPKWIRPGYLHTRANTLESLARFGLAQERMRTGVGLYWEYRATNEGIALCNSMGD
jgi:hypothetical protein